MENEKQQKWYFTFGCGQYNENCFVVFDGTCSETREKMLNQFGTKWSFQYSEKEWNPTGNLSQQEEYNLKQLVS